MAARKVVTTETLEFHPLAEVFPLMEGSEFDAFVADIKANGLREPILLYDGKILDGRNRARACAEAGIAARVSEHHAGCAHIGDPAAYVISVNIHRRHLTAEDRRDLLVKLVAAQPEKSDRDLAREAKVDHHQISRARKKAEATGTIVPVEKRTGADGKTRKRPKKKKKTAQQTEVFDETTGQTFKPLDPKEGIKNPIKRAWCKATKAQCVEFALDYREVIEAYAADEQRRLDRIAETQGRHLSEVPIENAPPPDVSADNMKAQFAEGPFARYRPAHAQPSPSIALDDGSDPGPIPECLRRAPGRVQ